MRWHSAKAINNNKGWIAALSAVACNDKYHATIGITELMKTMARLWLPTLARAGAILTLLVIPGYDGFLHDASHEYIYLISLLPIAALFLILLLLSGRVIFSAALTHLILLAMNVINAIKYQYTTVPLLFEDIMFLLNPLASWHILIPYVTIRASKICMLILLLVGLIYLLIKKRPVVGVMVRVRALLLAVAVLLVLPENLIIRRFYDYVGIKDIRWYQDKNLNTNGFVTTYVLSMMTSSVGIPRPDAEALRELHSLRPGLNKEIASKPDIIFYLSESLFDPGIINGIDHCEHLSLICQPELSASAGDFDVSVFGGGTTITEFSVLTGVDPNQFGNQLRLPYQRLGIRPVNSIAWELKALGYSTVAIHPNAAQFYNRHIAMPKLGFDKFISRKDFTVLQPKHGTYINDDDLNSKIIAQLDAANEPTFIMAISMENHGPWNNKNISDKQGFESIDVPNELPVQDQGKLREYLYRLQYTQQALSDLINWINQRHRPTVLFYFGDHLPALSQVFAQLGFDNGQAANLQDTVYVYYRKCLKTKGLPRRVAAWQVAPLVLHDLELIRPNEFYDLYRLIDGQDPQLNQESRSYLLKQAQLQQLYWRPAE